jgi:hypothetical protein
MQIKEAQEVAQGAAEALHEEQESKLQLTPGTAKIQ